ncbi:MAG TPA: LuxR C-terminal-related transcriptional regulator [Candidatus Limnocylindria bacterium]
MVWQNHCVDTRVDTNLSIRESQILRLVAAGMTTKEIAATLSIADSTVNWHVGNALAKLGAASRAEAVAIMLRDGPAEAPVVIVRPAPRARAAWPVAAVLAFGVALLLAGGTSVAAWYIGTHLTRPSDQAPSVVPAATTAPAASNSQRPPTASASTPAPQGAPATGHPVVAAPIASTAPVVPVTTPALPLATGPLLPGVPSLTPSPTLLPLPPLPTAPQLPLRYAERSRVCSASSSRSWSTIR